MIAEANRKKKDFSFQTRTQPMKSHKVSVYNSSANLLFLSVEVFSCPPGTCTWIHLLISNKTIFIGQISARLFTSGQHILRDIYIICQVYDMKYYILKIFSFLGLRYIVNCVVMLIDKPFLICTALIHTSLWYSFKTTIS